ncbi:MAG: hypothetical protein NWF07_04870, partial [Candidatus Bathyarchaeota archaeon]|nr:hypothetical protein [Candidatus Bathyarchaeota archaeon]
MGSQKYTPILTIVLALGLLGSIFLYADAKAELATAIIGTQQLQTQLSQLNNDYTQLSSQIATLNQI